MTRSMCLGLVVTLALALPATVFGGQVSIASEVPNYPYWEGCGPTAAGMIIGYWDAHGCGNLIPGSSSWSSSTSAAITTMMATPEHFYDYVGYGTGQDRLDVLPLSLPATYHADNSVADFMWASRGMVLADQSSFENKQISGLVGYANLMGYSGATGSFENYGSLWNDLVSEINAGRPAEFYVASSTSGISDHYVTVTGYDDTPEHLRYQFYDTWGDPAQWADFTYLASGKQWSVYSGTFFVAPEPATLVLLAAGLAVVARGRKRRSL
jgi:hypothetical protein